MKMGGQICFFVHSCSKVSDLNSFHFQFLVIACGQEYQLQLEAIQREAEELRQAEEDAKLSMEMTRRSQREDREQKRKGELERKKQLAIQNREREKKMMESARQKEQEMLESIGDAEMRTSLIEEMERKRDEEERLALERFEVGGAEIDDLGEARGMPLEGVLCILINRQKQSVIRRQKKTMTSPGV